MGAGQVLSASGWMWVDAFSEDMKGLYLLRFYDSEGSQVGIVGIASADSTSGWQYFELGDVAVPTGTSTMTVWLAGQQSTTGIVYFVTFS